MSSYIDLVDMQKPEHNWEAHYLLKEGDIFVEAGAFWGRYGKIASRKVGSSGKVILIEASPENQATIEDLIKRDGMSNVTLVKAAVWSSKGTSNFFTYGNPAGHRLDVGGEHQSNVIQVEMVPLDEMLPPLVDHVDLLGSDIEGAELEMVKGAKTLLEKGFIRNVAIGAYHDPGKPEQIIEILRGHGFKALKYEEGLVYGHS